MQLTATTMVPVTCLSRQVYDLVTKRDHVIQPIDYVDDQFTVDLTVVRQQFGAGTADRSKYSYKYLHVKRFTVDFLACN